MKLHYNPMSTNSRRAACAVLHCNANVELHLVDFQSDYLESKEFFAKNPNGMLPLLEDGNFMLWESNAIQQYVAEKSGKTDFWPKDPQARADISRWQFWQSNHFGPACDTLMWENFMKKMFDMGAPDFGKTKEALEDFRTYAQVLDQHLKGKTWICGSTVTVADYSVAANLAYASQSQMPLQEFPNLSQWFGRVCELDGWTKSAPKL